VADFFILMTTLNKLRSLQTDKLIVTKVLRPIYHADKPNDLRGFDSVESFRSEARRLGKQFRVAMTS
jgi:hypothetical protein